jgi:hypothetical protein
MSDREERESSNLVEVAQRLAGLNLEAVVDEPGLAVSLACK